MSHMKHSRHLAVPKSLPIQLSPRQVHPQRMVTQQPAVHSMVDTIPLSHNASRETVKENRRSTRQTRVNKSKDASKSKLKQPSWSQANLFQAKLLIHSIGTLTEANATYANFMTSHFGELDEGFLLRIIYEVCPSECASFCINTSRHSKYDILDLDQNLILSGALDCPCCVNCARICLMDEEEDSPLDGMDMQEEPIDYAPPHIRNNYEGDLEQPGTHYNDSSYPDRKSPPVRRLHLHNVKHGRCAMRIIIPIKTTICPSKLPSRIESPPGILLGWIEKKSSFFGPNQYTIYDAAELFNMVIKKSPVNDLSELQQLHAHYAHHSPHPHPHPHHNHHTQDHQGPTSASSSSSRRLNHKMRSESTESNGHKNKKLNLQQQNESVEYESDSETGEDFLGDQLFTLCSPLSLRSRKSLSIFEVFSSYNNIISVPNMTNHGQDASAKVSNFKNSEGAIALKLLHAASLEGEMKDNQLSNQDQMSPPTDESTSNLPVPTYKNQLLDSFNSQQQQHQQQQHQAQQQLHQQSTNVPHQMNNNNNNNSNIPFTRSATFFGSSHQMETTSNSKQETRS